MKSLKLVKKGSNSANPDVTSYKKYDQRTHVYERPDMYIGGDTREARNEWLLDTSSMKMILKEIVFTPGCERLFLEILSNSSDNVNRSRRDGVNPGKIEIVMNNKTISITNGGKPIPIAIHPEENMYVPEMIFGNLLTGSNYNEERHEAGTNGIGAKAVNVFSLSFAVIIGNHTQGLKYTQIWNDNMKLRGEPTIEQYSGESSFVQIIYEMDFARFKYDLPNEDGTGGYDEEAFGLFARHAADTSFTAKVPVIFNGIEMNYSNIREYSRLYFGDAVDSAIIHYQWPEGTEITKKKKGEQVSKNHVLPLLEFLVIDTTDNGTQVSFVNCMMTRDGGVHVAEAYKSIGDKVVKSINEATMKKISKQNKGKELESKDKRSHSINISDVKPHISIVLSCRVVNPKFTSQTKSYLNSPKPKIELTEEELKPVFKWNLIERLYATLEAKMNMGLSKTDGKLRKFVRLLNGIDANYAGKDQRHRCVLYITEGKSGASYADKLVGIVPGGRDYIGVLPMRGKGLNVMNAGLFQIEKNREIGELKKMLGLVESLPEQRESYYLDDSNFSKLRYGGIMIMADSDDDGKHIIGLILNLFYCRYPSLLARGYIMHYRTRIQKAWKGKQEKIFFTKSEIQRWADETPDSDKWEYKYYKGLGSSGDKDIAQDIRTPKVVSCVYDDKTPEAMNLAFNAKMTNQRKEWISNWEPILGADDIQMQPISLFIDQELILFSRADLIRSIPRLMDGYKEAHRKIIHAAHAKWKIGSSAHKEIKVSQFGHFTAEYSGYHHGETILDDVVVGMAQDFIGANNIPWFCKDGQFGTRYQGGKDAAQTRYSHTRPHPLVPYILRKEDQPILKHIVDEGMSLEPQYYYQVIPMVLINGAQGIATGWSTFIPNHNPLDIIKWLRCRIKQLPSKEFPAILPWYNGFKGIIKLIDRRRKNRGKVTVTTIKGEAASTDLDIDEDPDIENADEIDNYLEETEELEEEDVPQIRERPLLSMVTIGSFTINNNGSVSITELPIGRFAFNYHKWLEALLEEKKITGFFDRSHGDEVSFEITGFKDSPNYKTLKLKRSFGMSNMYLLDKNGVPRRYDTAHDILETFYRERLPLYEERKQYVIGKITEDINVLSLKYKFVKLVAVDKLIEVNDRAKADIRADMDRYQVPRELLDTTKLSSLTKEELIRISQKIAVKEQERDVMINTNPEDIWLNELNELEGAYMKHFGLKKSKKLSVKE